MTTNSGAADAALNASVDDQLPGAVLPEVPRRFVIFTYDADDEPELYLWGLQTERRAVAVGADCAVTHRAETAERIRRLVDLATDASLVWLDT